MYHTRQELNLSQTATSPLWMHLCVGQKIKVFSLNVDGTCDLLLNNRTGPKWGTSSLGPSHVTEDTVLSQACGVPDWLCRSKLPCCRLREQARGQKPGQCLRAGGGLQPRALTQSHNKWCNMLSEVAKRDSRWELSSGQHTDCGLAGGTVYPQRLVYNRSVWAEAVKAVIMCYMA